MTTKYAVTTTIGPKQTARALHAVRFAKDRGSPLNLAVTIEFSTLGVPEEAAGAFFRDLWSRVARWYGYQRSKNKLFGTFDALAVHENPPNGPRHVHWLIRAPEGTRQALEMTIRNRIEKLSGLSCLGKAVYFSDAYAPGQFAKYMLKGTHPAFAGMFFISHEFQGEVIGRRMTTSRSIGHAARANAGWRRKKR